MKRYPRIHTIKPRRIPPKVRKTGCCMTNQSGFSTCWAPRMCSYLGKGFISRATRRVNW